MNDNIFGKILYDLRKEKQISQKSLGFIFNVCNQTISAWERGLTEPDLLHLTKIADYFQVSVDYLLGREE